MAGVPENPKIYHITHVDNLPQIVSSGRVWSDAERVKRGMDCRLVGMSSIKHRRLEELEVDCHPGTKVGEYVPFYFCPRSVMLYILHRGNHPDIQFKEGQRPIVHLEADLSTVVAWANQKKRAWAFSDRNAGARYADFFSDLSQLNQINWEAVAATDFRDPVIKDGKQAEFLVFRSFPWALVSKIGVADILMVHRVRTAISGRDHCPAVAVEPKWYY